MTAKGGVVGKTASVDDQLADLERQGHYALLASFTRVYGTPAPKRLSDRLLRLAVAYRIQELAYGGLKPSIRKALLSGASRSSSPRMTAGSVLIREWQGRSHVVTVKPDRIEYAGERFGSLTEVARRITGQKRSGPAFFGVKKTGGVRSSP